MSSAAELLQQGKTKELWQKYCGFIDLSIGDFMDIQNRLLVEQLELLRNCELGLKVMRGARPRTVEEFRSQVPLTTYADYCPELLEKREDVLPEKPIFWQRTSGRSGEYPFKWVPVGNSLFREIGVYSVAVIVFASCNKRGDFNIGGHDKILYSMAPPPYCSGVLSHAILNELPVKMLPPEEKAEQMSFQERMQAGFSMALTEGMDIAFGLSSVLVAVGEQFSQGTTRGNLSNFLSHPRAWPRVAKGLIRSKLARRELLPKDIWPLKGLTSTGMDSSVYREKLKHYWGQYPLETYGCTEFSIVAMQTWEREGMTPVPTLTFYEFIPEDEYWRSMEDKSYQPRTVAPDELEAGHKYEMVLTSLQGGPFVRYRIGDMIKVTALRNEKLDIDLPQMVFDSRIDGIIDIGGFTRLTEKTIWQAIEDTGLAYQGWTARKELTEEPTLHVYIEMRDQSEYAEKVRLAIHQNLKEMDKDYADIEDMLGRQPLEVTLLPKGVFQRYMMEQQAKGADLAFLKPPQVNAPDEVINRLIYG